MKKRAKVFLIAICHLTIISCNNAKFSPEIEISLTKAGGNRHELENVINKYAKYKKDSLKLAAACFLINNLDGWYYYEGEQLDHYQDYLKLIRQDQNHGEYFLKSFNKLYGPFSIEKANRKYDIREVTSDQLIDNIECAFSSWQLEPWAKNISFQQFCNYILPFRILDEMPEYHRIGIYEEFRHSLDSIREKKGGLISAGTILNETLKKNPWIFSLRTSFLPHYNALRILDYRAGSCREMSDLAFYVMRAAGIPVAIDFIPQWPYRSMGHEFNVLLDENGKSIAFLGTEDDPGTAHKPLSRKGKVFRHMYSVDSSSLGMVKADDDIVPAFLADPRIKDVTDQYVKCFTVKTPMEDEKHLDPRAKKIGYLANKRCYRIGALWAEYAWWL